MRTTGKPWADPTLAGLELTTAVIEACDAADMATTLRQQQILDGLALYGTTADPGISGIARVLGLDEQGGVNVIASAVDTLVSEVTQNDTQPMVCTAGANPDEQARAKRLDKHIELLFDEHDVQSLMHSAARDAALAGLGCSRAYREGNAVAFERIHPLSIICDDRTCVDVLPRELFLRRAVSRRHMMALWPKYEDAIEHAPPPREHYWYSLDDDADVVRVIEAWRLPSSRDAEDGRHVVCIPDVPPLVAHEYTRHRFPLPFVRAIDPLRGIWGEAPVQRAAPAQEELTELLVRLSEGLDLMAVPRVFLAAGSTCTAHLTNQVGTIVRYQGAPPIFLSPPVFPAELYAQIDRLKQWIYELMGVSQLSATSQKPVGLDSEPAQRTYHEFQTRRFVNFERSLERAACLLAEDAIEIEREIAEDIGEYRVYWKGEDEISAADWRELDIDRDKLRVRVMPASALPRSPAGRMKALQDLAADGLVDRTTFYRHAPIAELQTVRDELCAPEDLIRKCLDRILETGDYKKNAPDLTMDLARAVRLCQLRIQKAELQELPQERVDLLRRWLDDCQQMQEEIAAKAAMAPGAAMVGLPSVSGQAPAPTPGPMPGPEAMPAGGPPMPEAAAPPIPPM